MEVTFFLLLEYLKNIKLGTMKNEYKIISVLSSLHVKIFIWTEAERKKKKKSLTFPYCITLGKLFFIIESFI